MLVEESGGEMAMGDIDKTLLSDSNRERGSGIKYSIEMVKK